MNRLCILVFLCSLISCIQNDGDISINAQTLKTNTPGPDTQNTDTSNQLLIDFEDNTTYSSSFVTSYKSSSVFTADFGVTSSLFGSKSIRCTAQLNSKTSGSCIHTTLQTFNLPIIVEFEFHAESSYFTGTRTGLSIFQDDGSISTNSNYGFVNAGNNALSFSWRNNYNSSLNIPWYSRYIEGYGLLSSLDPTTDLSLGDQGKFRLEIDDVGNWSLMYTKYDSAKSIIGSATYSGVLSSLPTNFKVQIFQSNYSNTGRSDTGVGQYIYVDNIIID